MKKHFALFFLVVLSVNWLAANGEAQEQKTDVPLLNRQGQVALRAVGSGDISVSAESDSRTTYLSFRNDYTERCLAALEGFPGGLVRKPLALTLDCQMEQGLPSVVVVLFFENDGGVWYRTGGQLVSTDRLEPIRIPLQGRFSRALFAADRDDTVDWEQVERVWVGLLVDGGSGVWKVRNVRFTNGLFQPTEPAFVGQSWEVSQDPAVQSRLEPSIAESHGMATMKYRFDIPGGRHMYAMVRTLIDVEELDAYSALRFTYQADLPEGIDGLLVMLIEKDGTQYRALPAPAESGEWKTVTIPFGRFERGSWSKDENDQLDLGGVSLVAIGMHGTTPAADSGTIKVRGRVIRPVSTDELTVSRLLSAAGVRKEKARSTCPASDLRETSECASIAITDDEKGT